MTQKTLHKNCFYDEKIAVINWNRTGKIEGNLIAETLDFNQYKKMMSIWGKKSIDGITAVGGVRSDGTMGLTGSH